MYNLPAQPTKEEQQQADYGDIQLEWTYPEFNKHERGIYWYIGFIGVGLILLWYCLTTGNFLLAILIILFAFILLNYHRHDPRPLDFQIRAKGIVVGSTFVPYTSLDSFWIVYDPPTIKTLYFMRKHRLRSEISIPLIETNPVAVRKLLEDILSEDLSKETETPNDTLGRMLKIH